jgi:hypothetical protein
VIVLGLEARAPRPVLVLPDRDRVKLAQPHGVIERRAPDDSRAGTRSYDPGPRPGHGFS